MSRGSSYTNLPQSPGETTANTPVGGDTPTRRRLPHHPQPHRPRGNQKHQLPDHLRSLLMQNEDHTHRRIFMGDRISQVRMQQRIKVNPPLPTRYYSYNDRKSLPQNSSSTANTSPPSSASYLEPISAMTRHYASMTERTHPAQQTVG